MSASDDDDSLSGSDRSHDHDSDMDDIFENIAAGPDDQWTHIAHSSRGSEMYDGLSKRSLPSDEFNLHYNYADKRLLAMAKEEVKHLLSAIRQKLRLHPEAKIDVVAAFAGAMPEEFLLKLFQWLKAGQQALDPNNTQQHKLVSFADLIEFIRCELILRMFKGSASQLESIFGIGEDEMKRYNRVRNAMKAADMPAAKRHAIKVERSSSNLTSAGPAAQTFDPLVGEVIHAINREWKDNFFVVGESWIDIDDDKLNNCSPKHLDYGMKRTPTKDKKEKPVNHIAATVGTGHICHITPDTIGLKLRDMLRDTIRKLCPNRAMRHSLGIFMDRGYLDLAKAQDVDVSNLIQIICEEDCKFLGTVKDSGNFPFLFVDINEDGKTVLNKRLMVQMYGMRSVWSARAKKAGKAIQASVLRHGAGKKRAARIVTNLPEAMTDAIVYETSASSVLRRREHASPPDAPIQENATIEQEISYAWEVFNSSIYEISSTQRTVEWFLGRLFRFTSTTFHASINVAAAEWLNVTQLQELHRELLRIVQLQPTRTVTFDNAADLEDVDLPSQRDGMHARLVAPNARHNNTTSEFWRRKSKPNLQNACTRYGVTHPPFEARTTTVNVLADCLAAHFQQEAEERERTMGTRIVADDDSESNERANIAFCCRMVPQWFMKPFKKKAGGAIDQGSANEELIIRVLRNYLEKFSRGKYTSRKVREFGVVAWRDCHACASSPDGVFPLIEQGEDGNRFISLCGLEIKTRSAVKATEALYVQAMQRGNWEECNSATPEFRAAIPDNAYRSQVIQHAAALGLDYVLMVYSLPGSHPKRMVLVRVSEDHRAIVILFQKLLSTKYMPFAYDPNAAPEICSLGVDYSNAYGYAQEHMTLELWLRIWVAYNKDVFEHGTPTSCKRLIDVATCLWNKCMGNVDTIRRVVSQFKAQRGKECGPGSLYWFHLMDYIFYQAFRVHQHSCIEDSISSMESHKQYLRKRKRDRPYNLYLFQLQRDLTVENMDRFFPGLRNKIDHMQPKSITHLSSNEMNAATGSIQPINNDQEDGSGTSLERQQVGYMKLRQFLDPSTPEFDRRLNTSLPHFRDQSTKTVSDGNERSRTSRSRCILCCTICERQSNDPTSSGAHTRTGRKSTDYCSTCCVYLCPKCYERFHSERHPTPPPCSIKYDRSNRSRTRSRSKSSSAVQHLSPLTRKRKRSTPAPSSPQGRITSLLRSGKPKYTPKKSTSPTSMSPPRRTRQLLDESGNGDGKRVRPRILYGPERDNDVPSPPKVGRQRDESGWRSYIPWLSSNKK